MGRGGSCREWVWMTSDEFLAGGGEMGALMRAHDWAATPLGPVAEWPQSLRTSISTCLNCAFPILVWWGPQLVMLYNDEYRTILGSEKHPDAFGTPGRKVWPDIWDVIGPMLDQVMTRGEATRSRDLLLVMDRHGYVEESYFSFSYSPIRDESGGIGGVFTPVLETTGRVIGERRLRTLGNLGARIRTGSFANACRVAAEALAENAFDIPFALIYALEEAQARLMGAAGVDAADPIAPAIVELIDHGAGWPFVAASTSAAAVQVDDLAARFERLPKGPWTEPPRTALVLPITIPGRASPVAVLIAAVNPRRALDAEHRAFFDLVAGQIGKTLADAMAHEEERKRAEALAELDRAKTLFFSNVSHEFRTPLTLLLGPLEELVKQADRMPESARGLVGLANRNGLRLLKLVNALLDFSRIEAGRARACFELTDLAAISAELAASFRAAIEQAGLQLIVTAEPSLPAVFVDREMWEKVIFNLLSNAFKFTFSGEIRLAIAMAADDKAIAVKISDTGTGIAAAELPHLFERFHRVEGAKGRSIEGSGIGLALVKELVKLHAGDIQVESAPGRGSTFTVLVPVGSEHLPATQIRDVPQPLGTSRSGSQSYSAEAVSWELAEPGPTMAAGPEPSRAAGPGLGTAVGRVLLAEDNPDMRGYISRLLVAEGYQVEAVADGEAALRAARGIRPDLILSDVMMPRMDGFALLASLRADPALRDRPVVLISARAGEEARVEGFEANADDYLIKPFSARELLVRVKSNLTTARMRRDAEAMRRESEARLRIALDAASAIGAWDWDLRTDRVHVDAHFARMFSVDPARAKAGAPLSDFIAGIHPEDRDRVAAEIQNAIDHAVDYKAEFRILQPDNSLFWVMARGRPYYDDSGRPDHFPGVVVDITDRIKAEQQRTLLVNELNHRVKNTLATVQSLAAQSLRGAETTAEARLLFDSRLAALSRAHDLLTLESWEGASLQDVVDRALEPFQFGDGRLATMGPKLRLSPRQALGFSMAIHELATNAVKYGALSSDHGRVQMAWFIDRDGLNGLLNFSWREQGGPLVAPPRRIGFGSRLIQSGLSMDLGGDASIDFRPEGVVAVIRSPLENSEPYAGIRAPEGSIVAP